MSSWAGLLCNPYATNPCVFSFFVAYVCYSALLLFFRLYFRALKSLIVRPYMIVFSRVNFRLTPFSVLCALRSRSFLWSYFPCRTIGAGFSSLSSAGLVSSSSPIESSSWMSVSSWSDRGANLLPDGPVVSIGSAVFIVFFGGGRFFIFLSSSLSVPSLGLLRATLKFFTFGTVALEFNTSLLV
jgi:hypothetical protein